MSSSSPRISELNSGHREVAELLAKRPDLLSTLGHVLLVWFPGMERGSSAAVPGTLIPRASLDASSLLCAQAIAILSVLSEKKRQNKLRHISVLDFHVRDTEGIGL